MTRGAVVGLLALAVAGSAKAFSVSQSNGQDIKWSANNLSYWLDANGAPTQGVGSAALDPVRAGAATWNGLACSSVQLTEAGTVTGASPFLVSKTRDGKNLITWVTSGWPYDKSTLAVTTPVYSVSTGIIVEADIAMNGNVPWTTALPMGTKIDVQSVATHELGHFFGLQHVLGGDALQPPPTMAPHIDPTGGTRVPKPDDIAGACYLYPATPYTCSSIDQCPYILASQNGTEFYSGRINCSGSTCSGIVGVNATPGALGSLCRTSSDCSGGLTCIAYAGSGYCTQACALSTNTSCPTSFTCVAVSGGTGSCFPAAINGGCACNTSSSCEASCSCDPDCGTCACNKTGSCDSNCSCDPDCDGGGCAAVPATRGAAGEGAGTALLFAAFVYVFARAKRRRHGGERSGDV